MAEDRPTEKPPFWTSLPGILTASATAVGAVTALVTALYTAGIIGQPKPEPKPAPPPVTQPSPSPQPAADETSQKSEDARRQEQAAAEALQKATAEADRLRRELDASRKREVEARTQSELDAARRRAEEAEGARLRAEAELNRLRREREAAELSQRGTAPFVQDTVDFKVGVQGAKVTLDVRYTFDPSRKGPIYASASLLYQGKRISAPQEKPRPLTQSKGDVRMELVVRPERGRQSDELEVYVTEGRERIAVRRIPFVRTFESGLSASPAGAGTSLTNLDTILDYRVAVSGTEVTIKVLYSFDPARKGPIYASASLLYQGKRIAVPRDRAQSLTESKGTAQIPLVVRTNLGRQSDEIEIVLLEGKDRFVIRRFPFVRSFDGAS
jgi:acyl-coenzyme A thioesterase PaaI-like protein